jgi:hypothetical protein
MKYAIFPFTYALDNRKNTELFVLIGGDAAIWVITGVGIRKITKVTTNVDGTAANMVLAIEVYGILLPLLILLSVASWMVMLGMLDLLVYVWSLSIVFISVNSFEPF